MASKRAKQSSMSRDSETTLASMVFPMRLNRYMALKGLATRRGADELIKTGLVSIDGQVATLGTKVMHADQVVRVQSDAESPRAERVYYVYYKPRGIITHSPQKKERSIREVSGISDVFPVGRLDKDSEGLIILTNDGRITERLLHPRFEHEKEYVVTVREAWPVDTRVRLERGVEEGGEQLTARKVSLIDKHRAQIILTEGKKHEIRRMLAVLGLTVIELRRVRIMHVHLGAMKSGEYRALTGKAKEKFLKDLGLV